MPRPAFLRRAAQMNQIILNVIIGNSAVWQVKAEDTGLGPSPLETPDVISGKLVGLTTDDILKIKFGDNTKVGFDGGRYEFTSLEKDGTFQLRRVIG